MKEEDSAVNFLNWGKSNKTRKVLKILIIRTVWVLAKESLLALKEEREGRSVDYPSWMITS